MQAGNRFRSSDQPDGIAKRPSHPLPIPWRFHLRRPCASPFLAAGRCSVSSRCRSWRPGNPSTNQAIGNQSRHRRTNRNHHGNNDPTNDVDPDETRGRLLGGGRTGLPGLGDAVTATAKGLSFMARHPFQAAQGIGTAIRHPIQTGQAIGQMMWEKSGTLHGQGELVGDVLIGVATGGAIKAASKTGAVARFASKVRQVVGRTAIAAERAVEGAGAEAIEAAGAEAVEAAGAEAVKATGAEAIKAAGAEAVEATGAEAIKAAGAEAVEAAGAEAAPQRAVGSRMIDPSTLPLPQG